MAVEGIGSDRRRVFLRYADQKRQRPLRIIEPEDVGAIYKIFFWAKPRAFYASTNVYVSLDAGVLEEAQNIYASTPTFDVDEELGRFRDVVDVARMIVDELGRLGIARSVYILWSGRGAHVRVNELAFSLSLRQRYNPLDMAYSIVEYILRRLSDRTRELVESRESRLKVENLMDVKRVFTAPLSLHRELDVCAICLKPRDLESFDPSWADPSSPRHDPAWREFLEGEADEAALTALREIPGYFVSPGTVKTVVGEPSGGRARTAARVAAVGRFQVMAILQAARYYVIYGDLERAKSFGLNRAIFYAWAKRRRVGQPRKTQVSLHESVGTGKRVARVGDESAYVSDDGWFEIGGQAQTPADYDREIASKISAVIPYDEAWRRAIEHVKSFDSRVLESQREFYAKVYQPVRDVFLSES